MYQRLGKLFLSASHGDLMNLLDTLGEGFDTEVIQWRDMLNTRTSNETVGVYYTSNMQPKHSTVITGVFSLLGFLVWSQGCIPGDHIGNKQ